MTSSDGASAICRINQLHAEVVRRTGESRECLHTALVAAWEAGRLLLAERQRVRRAMGAAWGEWLSQRFDGSQSTAYHYMRLADTVSDITEFRGMSLRQVYFRLGIATEPKCRVASPKVPKLPQHIRLASRLMVTLNQSTRKVSSGHPHRIAVLRQDLRALYEQLRQLFEAGADFPDPASSDRSDS